MSKPTTDTDNPWKLILTVFFEQCIAFTNPSLYELIDWSRPVEFLEQELHEIVKTRFRGAKLCDKLAKVWLKSGESCWILLHVEVESAPRAPFARRFYWYRILISDMHKTDFVISMAIYTGPRSKWQVDQYSLSFMGNEITFKFPVFKVWEQREEDLINSDNPFALLVLAQQFANKTRKDMDKRLAFRQKLFELATERKIPKRHIWHLLIFVRYLTALPPSHEKTYSAFTQKKLNQNPGNMGVTMDDIKWLDSLLEVSTGDSVFKQLESYRKKAERAELKAKEAMKRAELKAKEAKEAKKQAETEAKEAKKQAETEAKEAKEAKKQAETETQQFHATIVKCYRERKWSIEEISTFFDLPVDKVQEILRKRKR